jgi:hypothetical protein
MFVAKGTHPPHPAPIFVFALRAAIVVTPDFTDSLIAPFMTFYNQIRMREVCDTEEMILAWQLQIWVSSSRSVPSSGPLEPDPIMKFEGGSSSTFYLIASAGVTREENLCEVHLLLDKGHKFHIVGCITNHHATQ